MTHPHLHDDPAGDEHDAWLAEALRHAPDAGADASPALSEAILREARSAPAMATGRGQRGHWQGLLSAWRWLARPPVAAGFASVLMATLIGLMWRDLPLDDAVPPSPAPSATTAPPAAAPARIADPAPDSASDGAAPAVTLPARPPRPRERTTFPVDTPATPSTEAAVVAAPEPAESRSTRPETAPAAGPSARADEPARERADAGAAKAARAAPANAGGPSATALGALPSGASGLVALSQPARAGSAPLAGLLADIAQAPDHWRWQRGGGDTHVMSPGLQRWLAQLDRAAVSQWGVAAGRASRDGPVALRLWRDGTPQAALGFDDGTVWVEITGTPASTTVAALLPEAAIEALKNALNDATP